MNNQKVYVGNGKQIDTQYGKLLKLSFSKKDLELMLSKLNAKGYINLNCNERRSVSEWGHTHSMQIDDWQPNQQAMPQSNYNPDMDNQNQGLGAPVTHVANNPDNFDDTIPF